MTFDESRVRRGQPQNKGQFAAHVHAEVPGGTSALGADSLSPGVVNARIVLRGFGAGRGLVARLADDEAVLLAEQIAQDCTGKPVECHGPIARAAINAYLEVRAAADTTALTPRKAAEIQRDAISVHHVSRKYLDHAWARLEQARAEGFAQTEIAVLETETVNADEDLTAAARRREQATWDLAYLTEPAAFDQQLLSANPNVRAAAVATAARCEDANYPGAVGP